MLEEQKLATIQKDDLLKSVKEYHDKGYRLIQISCTKLDTFELTYSFDKDYEFTSIRLQIPLSNPQLPSISNIYWSAFLYENEIHDLFGIKVKDLALDYKGNFYRMSLKTPFNITKKE
ncbi:MAG: NADH-quinone oxidoreductase subunit C [Candidatus Ancaeobacter aquaticus]|nr:NADH-quinone oxidoreductase subunit C [Candidatus Ancaeobacter aquaticus]